MSRKKKKIRAQINKMVSENTIQNINETKRLFIEKLNKIDKLLTIFIKKIRERTQINKSEVKKK